MRIFTRYVFGELIRVFLFALLALTGLMVLGGVIREGVEQNLPPAELLRITPFLLPQMLCITLPVTLLLAVTSVYARMSGSNEVIAIKASGISPSVIIWPALVLAFLLSLTTVWLYDLAVSWGRNGVQSVVIEALEEIAYSTLRTQKNFTSPAFSIIVKDVRGRQLIGPIVSVPERENVPAFTISAEEAELRSDLSENVLRIYCRNFQVYGEGSGQLTFPGVEVLEAPLGDASKSARSSSHPSNLPLRSIPGQIVAQRKEITEFEHELAINAAEQMLLGEFDELAGQGWQASWKSLDDKRNRYHRLRTEPHRRWSAGFSCLCFIWVGVPMAIRLKNRDFLTSFFLCFLPILVVYYPLLMWGVDGAKEGRIPPWSVWAGNALLIAWGVVLLRKVMRY